MKKLKEHNTKYDEKDWGLTIMIIILILYFVETLFHLLHLISYSSNGTGLPVVDGFGAVF